MSRLLNRTCFLITVISVVAGVAPAAAAAHEWQIEGANLGGNNVESVEVRLPAGGALTLKGEILGRPAERVECKKVKSAASKIIGEGRDEGALKLSECTMPTAKACRVEKFETEVLTSELDEAAAEKVFDELTPKAGEVLAWVTIEGCALAGEWEVTGSIAGFDPVLGLLLKEHIFQFSGELSAEAGTAISFAGKPATLSGFLEVNLSGANVGKKWLGL